MTTLISRIKSSRIFLLVISMLMFSSSLTYAEEEAENKIDMKEILFGHIGDSYSWHLWTSGGHHVSIPLLIIVKGSNGWDMFSASRVHDGEKYDGYFISQSEANSGKIVELAADGSEVRPLDLSITKNVLSLFFVAALMLAIFLSVANKYKKDPLAAPSGLQAFVEPLILAIDEDVTKPCIGEKYKTYSSYILTAFFFILFANFLGIIPFFPGGANVTGNIAITMVLACITFVITNISGSKHYWKDIFWPNVPTWLKVPIPIMPFIELLGIFTKPIALAVRLFANMLSGHFTQLILVSMIFILSALISPAVGGCVSVFSVAIAACLDLLECLVCFIQAYVFAMLSALFIGLAVAEPKHEA